MLSVILKLSQGVCQKIPFPFHRAASVLLYLSAILFPLRPQSPPPAAFQPADEICFRFQTNAVQLLIGHCKHIHKHQDRIYCNQIFIKPIQQNLLMEQLIRHQKKPCKGVRFQVLLRSSCFITCCRIQHRTIFYIALVCIFHIAVDMIQLMRRSKKTAYKAEVLYLRTQKSYPASKRSMPIIHHHGSGNEAFPARFLSSLHSSV